MIVNHDFRWSLKQGDSIFLLHIPKTAGATTYRYIMNRFPPEEVFIATDRDLSVWFENTNLDQFSGYRFFRQHADYDFYRFIPRKPVYITFLCGPVNRLYSFFKHIQRVKRHHLHQLVVEKSMGIVDFMDLIPEQTSNQQLRLLVGNRIFHHMMGCADVLEIAKMRLCEFAFFGIQECFEVSMRLLHYIFHWEMSEYKSDNVAPEEECELDLREDEIEIIRARNQMDIARYQYSIEMFKKQSSDHG